MEIRRCVWIVAVSVLLLAVHGAENTRNGRPKSTSAGQLDNRDGRRDRTPVADVEDDEWASSGDDDLHDEDEGLEPFDEDEDEEDEGSGIGEPDEDFGEDGEEDDEDEFGSAGENIPEDVPPTTTSPTSSLTTCQRQRSEKLASDHKGYRPQCTKTGAFQPMQCYRVTNECWCVDSGGNQKGELYRAPQMPVCHPDSGPQRPDGTQSAPADDFTIIETSTPHRHMQTPKGEYNQKSPEMEPLPAKNWFDYLLRNPLILAAAIGGSVLILVMIVLLLMFCIYRMRKKDEGSYSLDEPRQTFNYTRAKDQEFFA